MTKAIMAAKQRARSRGYRNGDCGRASKDGSKQRIGKGSNLKFNLSRSSACDQVKTQDSEELLAS